jgi:hypothetical protein
LVDRRKQAKLQWLQYRSKENEVNLINVRREASRHLRHKKREYLKDKTNELQSNSKNKNIRDVYMGIKEFKKFYQSRTNLVKDERGDLLADPHNILNRWKNYFCELLNVHGTGGVCPLIFCLEILKGREHSEDIFIDEKIILKRPKGTAFQG